MTKIKSMRAAGLAKLGASLTAIVVAATLGASTTAFAQTSDATLRGTAPAGATIVVKSIDTGAVRKTTAGPDGTYVIVGLPSGNYHVSAGDKQSGDVSLSVASVSVYDFDSSAAHNAGTITVVGKRPTVEIHSSQVNQIVTLHDIAALPQSTRNFLEFADTVPGVQFSEDSSHATSLRGGAQLASAVNVFIDGVSQKDYIGGGSGITGSSGVNGGGDLGNPFPQLAIGEYKVVTSNYTAEYGDASSTVIIAQTKSGTNTFHGEAFGSYTDQSMRASRAEEIANNVVKPSVADKEYGVALGGPIIKDVLHFFATWEHKSLSGSGDVYPSQVPQSVVAPLLPANVASQFGPTSNPFTENLYFGKLDLEPTAEDRIELSGKFRLEHSITGGNGQNALSTQQHYVNNDKRGDLRWMHNADHWTNEVKVDYQNTNSSTASTSASPQFDYVWFGGLPANNVNSSIINVGGPGSGNGQTSAQKGFTFQDNFTASNVHFAGDHTLKFGVSYGGIKLTSAQNSADLANATYYYAVTPAGVAATPYEVQFPNLTAGYNSATVTTTDKQYSAYAQDNWNVNSHLEVNLGVRWDHEVVPAYLNYITPANVLAGINGLFPGSTTQTYAQVLAQGAPGTPGTNLSNYISTGNNRKAPNNFSPRIGFSYDIDGDSQHVIFGGYARAYNRNQFQSLALETTKIALNGNPQVYFPFAGSNDSFGACQTNANVNPTNHCYAWDASYLTPAGLAGLQTSPTSHEVDMMNNNIKTPHSDQFSIGMRNKIGDWNTEVTASYVESFDGIVGHFGNRYANGGYFNSTGSQWGGSSGVPGVGTLILWDNGAKDRDFQLGVAAQKPYTKSSGWGMTVSYTFTAAAQNNLAGGSNPYQIGNNQYLFDLPSPSQYPMLRATAAPRSRIVATYSRDVFWGLSMAAKLTLATPQSSAATVGCPSICNAQGGTVAFVSQPPSNLIGYKDLDMQISKNVDLPYGTSAWIRLDILNVFNWHNYDPGATQFIVPASATTLAQVMNTKPTYNLTGPTVGNPFTLKVSAGVKF